MRALLKLLPKPTAEGTARLAIDVLAELGVDRSNVSYDAEELQLRVNGHRIWLGNLLAQQRMDWPWRRRAATRQFLRVFLEAPERPPTLADARGHLLPGVRDSFMFEALRLQSAVEGGTHHGPSGRALGSRQWLSLFLDYPQSTSVVTTTDLAEWGASIEDALAVALENLAARSREPMMEVAEGLYHSPWQDRYDPARILLREVLAPLDLPGDPVAFAPNWNHLLVTGSENTAGVAAALAFSMKVLEEEPRPMSALPLVRRSGEWVDLELPSGHPLEPLLRKARVRELGAIYPEQGKLIGRLHEKEGTDLYVAAYNGSLDRETDEHDAYAVWSKGVPTLLPRAERIVFFDNDQPEGDKLVAQAEWAIVALHCAARLEDAGFTPARYLVESFPTLEELEAMRAAQAARSAARATTAPRA